MPGSIDLAVISLRADRILKALIDAGERGVAYALITPDENAYASDATWLTKLQLVADQYGMRLHRSRLPRAHEPGARRQRKLLAQPAPSGNIALITQSGMIGTALLDYAQGAELGFSGVVSTGAAIDVDMPELIDYYANDKNTRVIALHIEGIRRPREVLLVPQGRLAQARRHPQGGQRLSYAADRIACFKMGTDAGSEGALAALVERAGATLVPSLRGVHRSRLGLCDQPPSRGNRIAVIANGSGFASLTASAAQACGIDLHGLSNATIKDLKTAYPSQQIAVNPSTWAPRPRPSATGKTLQIVLQDPMIDGALSSWRRAPSPRSTRRSSFSPRRPQALQARHHRLGERQDRAERAQAAALRAQRPDLRHPVARGRRTRLRLSGGRGPQACRQAEHSARMVGGTQPRQSSPRHAPS